MELAAQAGARVVTSTLLGKGASMEDGVWAAQNETVLFLDGDLCGLPDDLEGRVTAPILERRADFVKTQFSRSAGRETMVTARPLLKTFFPELNHIEQQARALRHSHSDRHHCPRRLAEVAAPGDVVAIVDLAVVVAVGGEAGACLAKRVAHTT